MAITPLKAAQSIYYHQLGLGETAADLNTYVTSIGMNNPTGSPMFKLGNGSDTTNIYINDGYGSWNKVNVGDAIVGNPGDVPSLVAQSDFITDYLSSGQYTPQTTIKMASAALPAISANTTSTFTVTLPSAMPSATGYKAAATISAPLTLLGTLKVTSASAVNSTTVSVTVINQAAIALAINVASLVVTAIEVDVSPI